MLDWTQLGIAWGLTLGLTLIVAAFMQWPLYAVLQLVCGTGVGARFWTIFSSLMIVVGPLFLVSIGALGTCSLAEFVRRAMVMISLGLIVTVTLMGFAVWSATRTITSASTVAAE
ncbi:hypothetical protein [Acidisphaera sp. S103]|uniref:hypothetical protein n=1 Tax=Acidisphaera sp. S103 TaxID=1747223 RepID=UPI00131D79E2|nr:hypothetical protein [Acidisphaera sp. S103]